MQVILTVTEFANMYTILMNLLSNIFLNNKSIKIVAQIRTLPPPPTITWNTDFIDNAEMYGLKELF